MGNKAYNKIYRENRKKLGLCRECGKSAKENCCRCEECILKNNDRTKKRKRQDVKNKVCVCCRCQTSTEDTTYCQECLVKLRQYNKKVYYQKKCQGLCQCGEQNWMGKIWCLTCWLKKISWHIFGSNQYWQEIRNLFSGKCPYTGKIIILGLNAQLDHKTPTKRGGSNSIDNLQWISTEANQLKNKMTHEEFEDYLKLIRTYPESKSFFSDDK